MIKKIALFALLSAGISGISNAWDFGLSQEANVYVKYSQDIASTVASTAAVVVDLSDFTNWPHAETREPRVSWMRVSLDKAAASTDTVKVGVVTAVDTSSGSVTWFYSLPSLNNVSNTNVVDTINYAPNWINLRVNPNSGGADGDTPYILSNDTSSDDTAYQTDITLPNANGAYTAAGIGDIILEVSNSVGTAVTVTLELIYQTVKR
jgi:hypothetical protein